MKPATTIKLLKEAKLDLLQCMDHPTHTVDLDTFGVADGVEAPQPLRPQQANTCGTVACIAGTLSLLPKWRERGFVSHWAVNLGNERDVLSYSLLPGSSHTSRHRIDWLTLAERVFGITEHEAAQLFRAAHPPLRTQHGVVYEINRRFNNLIEEYEQLQEVQK